MTFGIYGRSPASGLSPPPPRNCSLTWPTATPPNEGMFQTAPSEEQWRADLSAQTRLEVTAAEALAEVREAWKQITGD